MFYGENESFINPLLKRDWNKETSVCYGHSKY